MVDTGLQHLEEFALREARVRIAPGRRRIDPMAVGMEQAVEQVGIAFAIARAQGGFAAGAAQMVDDLVLEHAGREGAQRTQAGKGLGAFEQGEHRFGNHVFGHGIIAQLQARKTQQRRAQFGDLLVRIRRLGGHAATVGKRLPSTLAACSDWSDGR